MYRWSHLRVCTLRLSLLWGIGPFRTFLPSLYSSTLLKASKLVGLTLGVPQSLSFPLTVIQVFLILFSQPAGNSSAIGDWDGWPLQCSGLAQLVLPGRDLALVAASCAPTVGMSVVQALGVSPLFLCMPWWPAWSWPGITAASALPIAFKACSAHSNALIPPVAPQQCIPESSG